LISAQQPFTFCAAKEIQGFGLIDFALYYHCRFVLHRECQASTMERVVTMEVGDDGVALVTLNKPPVNSLDNSSPNSCMWLSISLSVICLPAQI
jgi:hypothetical protein